MRFTSVLGAFTRSRFTMLALLGLFLSLSGTLRAQAPAKKEAPVPVVVFSDFECTFSSKQYFILQKLQAKYPGRFRVVYKASPLPIHPGAPLAHRAAFAAARQGKYDAMAQLLYASQREQSRAALIADARRLQLDIPRFTRDLDSASIAQELATDAAERDALAVVQTPTLFVAGHRLTGLQSEADLAPLVMGSAQPAAALPSAAGPVIEPTLLTEIQTRPTASLGATDAPLTLVEFTDFQCPFCRAAVEPMEKLLTERGQQVRWEFRAFPLDFHPDAELAAEAALAAGDQGKFWPMHDLLFAHQNALKLADLHGYAEQLNLNTAIFDEALATHRFAPQVAADRALGLRAGVNGTPSFIIDGHVVTGARTLPELEQLAEAHLNLHTNPAAPVVSGLPSAGSVDHIVTQSTSANPITLTWFTDVRSTLAARQAELLRSLSARYGDRLRVVYKAYPTSAHPDGTMAAAALLAAHQQGYFWPMFDALAERRDTLDEAKLISLAQALHLETEAFRKAIIAARDEVSADRSEAARRGIQGAPVIFIDAQRVDGLQPVAAYTAILDSTAGAKTTQSAAIRK